MKAIKKMRFILLMFLVTQLGISCYKDNVVFINEGDNLPITLALEFKFDENSGQTATESQTQSSFTIEGRGINRMAGVSNNALFFDGLSNEIKGTLPTNLLSDEKFVMSLWVSPKSYPIGTGAMFALTSQGSSTGLMVGINKFGQLVVQYFIEGAFAQQVSIESIERDKWNHIVVGLNPADQSIEVYLNRQSIRKANVPAGKISWPATNTPFSIGKNTMGEMMGVFDIDYFSGAIDEINVYSGEANQEVVDFLNAKYTPPSTVNYEVNIDYSNDSNRPTYHTVPDIGWANESYGLIERNGTYHMFYQKNEVFLGIAQQNWGHFTSTDLVNWDERNAILWPSEDWDNFGCWSGGSIILNDDTPAIVYTGVDGIKAVVGSATSNDNFQSLTKNPNPIINGAPSDTNLDFRDPFVWEDGGMYHMLIGGGVSNVGGNVLYYSSNDFENWSYQGVSFSGRANRDEGQFWEVPILYEFPNGKELLLVQKTPDATSARTFYWIGEFNNGVFTPDFPDPKNLEVVNGFLSPTVTTDNTGLITAIGIIPDEVDAEFHLEQGWANLFSIPQVWDLDGNNNIVIKPHPNVDALRGSSNTFNNVDIQPGSSNYFNGFNSRHFEMGMTLNVGTASQVGFVLGKSSNGQEEYRIYYDVNTQEWIVDASNSSLSSLVRKDVRKGSYAIAPNTSVDIRLFVDGSVVEVFIDDKSHFTGRFFPTLTDATGVDLFASGGNANANVTIYQINN